MREFSTLSSRSFLFFLLSFFFCPLLLLRCLTFSSRVALTRCSEFEVSPSSSSSGGTAETKLLPFSRSGSRRSRSRSQSTKPKKADRFHFQPLPRRRSFYDPIQLPESVIRGHLFAQQNRNEERSKRHALAESIGQTERKRASEREEEEEKESLSVSIITFSDGDHRDRKNGNFLSPSPSLFFSLFPASRPRGRRTRASPCPR